MSTTPLADPTRLRELVLANRILAQQGVVDAFGHVSIRHPEEPGHYLIADRHGKAFVWEHSHVSNREHIIENPGKPLITTNFSLHRHLEGKGPPSAKAAKGVCPRYCALAERIAAEGDKVTVDTGGAR